MTNSKKLNLILEKVSNFDEKVSNLDKRVNNLDNSIETYRKETNNRFDKIESEVSALRAGQIDIRKELEPVNSKVSETYQLALDAWGTSTENRKWLEAAK